MWCARESLSATESGPVGLLEGKRAIVLEGRGGFFSDGPTKGMDTHEPHLPTLLGFMGIKDVTFVRAEKLAFGPDVRRQSIETARTQLGRAVHEYQPAI
jgi:FMN-dependent NADH-azoreductase